MNDFSKESYQRHIEEFNDFSEQAIKKHNAWFDENSVDYWRHLRMIAPITPLLINNKSSKWLTVGDGRFGLDSIKLKRIEPSIDVLPTDISPYLLEKSKEAGNIEKFSVENAEKLSFDDETFDFSFCKEAYHHFPRPYVAVYEMLRVSKKAIIFSEPNDHHYPSIYRIIISGIKSKIKGVLGKKKYHLDTTKFEPSGNYIYTISPRELEKIALGLHLPMVAHKYFNDYYTPGIEFENATESNFSFKLVQRKIKQFNLKSKLGIMPYAGIIGIIFKEIPTQKVLNELKEQGFYITKLPINPYL